MRRDRRQRRVLSSVSALLLTLALPGGFAACGGSPPVSERSIARPLAEQIPQIPDLDQLDPAFANSVRSSLAAALVEPASGTAVGALGRLYEAHRYVDQARRCYEIASRLEPEAADWPYHLGVLSAGGGGHEEAARHFERVLELRPSFWAARVRLGNALLAANDLAAAEQAFRRARSAAPATPWGELGLGRTARRRGDFAVAAAHLRTALALDPNHREVRYLLAMTERQLGNQARADDLFRGLSDLEATELPDPLMEAVRVLQRDAQTLIRTANRLVSEGDHVRAEQLYREVLRLDPDSRDAHLNLGVLHGLADRNREAAASLERAVEIDPERADAHALLTIAYIKTGRVEEGLAHLERALEIDPDHPRALEILRSLGGRVPSD